LTSVTREGPSASQCSTSATKQTTLHLNAFRGEPAISVFDWHFTRLPTAHPSILQHTPVRASTGSYTRFPLAMGRSRSFGSADDNIDALFGLAFAQPPCQKHLSRYRQQLAGSLCKRHAITQPQPRSDCLQAIWVQVLFHSPPGVLFTFPSRYWFTIGGNVYLALGGGPPGFPQASSWPVVLGYHCNSKNNFVRDSHPLW